MPDRNSIHLPDDLYEQCKLAAAADGRSLASWVRWVLSQAVKETK